MSENAFYAAFFFPAAAVVLVFFMKYVSAVLQARVRLGQDEAYRELAAKAAAAQAETAATLGQIQSRLAAVEKLLKDVG
jgi:uncharacterized protein YbaA (DUF1428 family)